MNGQDLQKPNEVLEDISALEYILLGDLRDLLEEAKEDAIAWKWIAAIVDTLLEKMPVEFAMRDCGGYMEEVLEEHPNWQGEVETLYCERCELFKKLGELQKQMLQSQSVRKIANELQHDLRDWINLYTDHRHHERRIVQNAFNYDIGAAD
ncbi:hypothetical protein MNBD_PLANCTO02-295 [hydrothermal vent metagenome]|uniref:Hemerythrin-like domain-containing protein n=1 Tax=hydrothermal vent metagenome TaxID=652676 RepID=A0A3B1E1A7_9ZZZZ